MKFINFSKALNSKKGEIGTIVVLIGMAVIGLGILVGSQIRDGRINFLPRATAAADPIWAGAKAAPGNIYPWSNGGPTTGWESYFAKRVYICNGNYCWTLERATPTGPVTWVNNGNPFNIQTEYSTLKSSPNGVFPWSGNGPTSAWTWELPNGTRDDNRLFPNVSKETIINETMLCNGTYCWRHVRTATDGTGFWRDGDDADTIQGDPIRLNTRDFWKDKPGLYTNNGPTVGWNDPVNKKATLCNEGYCESVSYGNSWVWAGTVSPYPAGKGVTKYTAAWTSPSNIISLCTFNTCWPFTLSSGGGSWGSDSAVITPPATATCLPTLTSPARNATVTSNPTFVWSACPGASVKYRIEVMGNATPSTVLFVGTSYSFTSPIPTWVAGRTYTWKVKACPNADCMGGTFSSESQFTYNTTAPVATNTKAPVATNSPTPKPPTNTPTPRPATNSQALWDQIKPIAVAGVNIYPWTSGGPTAGWESPSVNRAYICNGKYCWVLDRNTLSWVNGGLPFNTETEYSTLKASTAATGGPKTGVLPWSEKGITSAWTWNVAYQGGFVDETVLCNGNYCWRHLKMPNNAAGSGWRDNGNPIYLPTYGNTGSVWTDTRVAALWTGNGITVAWTDPVNGRATLCNRGDCRSLDYKNWQWRFNGAKITPFPAPANSGVTEYTSAWTSPATNVISLCNANRCWLYDINASGYAASSIIFSSNVATPTIQPCIPTLRSPARSASVTSNPTFEWSACPGTSVKYRIEVTGNATPSTVLFVGTRYSFTSPIPAWVAGRTYTWKVKACPNADCIGGTFSSESQFTYAPVATVTNTPTPTVTKTPTPTPTIQTCVPTLRSPVRNATVTSNPAFEWSACPGTSVRYRVEVMGNATPSTVLFVGTRYSFTSPIPAWVVGRTYTWKVKACPNADCIGGTFSSEFQFTYNTVSVPPKWTLTLSAVCTDTKAVLNPDYATLWRWNDGSPAAATQGTAQPVIINGAAGKTYSIQLRGNQSLPVQNATVTGMTKGTDNTLTWTSTTLPAGAHSIAYVAEASACKVPDSCPRKREGDANCNSVVDTLDAVCWVEEALSRKPANCISADFNSNGIVGILDLLDISVWRSTMIKEKSTR